MSHIFVSYASEDQDRIMPVVRALEATGWSVFWDRTIPVGETWQKIVGAEIEACRCMVVIWSATSINKEWVYEEASEGKRRGVLAPVLIDDVIPPIGFRSIQAAKLEGWDGKAASTEFDRLVKDISRMLETPPIKIEEQKQQADPQAARRAEIDAALYAAPGASSSVDEYAARPRVLDAAIPSHVVKDRSTELLVLIRLPDSRGLKGVIQEDEDARPRPEDVRSKPFCVTFPLGPMGKLGRLKMEVKITSPDFSPEEQTKTIFVPPDADSEVISFLLTPRRVDKLFLLVELQWEEAMGGQRRLSTKCVSEASELPLHAEMNLVQMEVSVGAGATRPPTDRDGLPDYQRRQATAAGPSELHRDDDLTPTRPVAYSVGSDAAAQAVATYPTSQTTLPSLDNLKPSINASGDSGLIQAIATNDAFPASPANITVGQLSAQVAPGGQFKLPGVNNVPVGFSVSTSANSALAAYQNPANLPSDLGFSDTDGQQLDVSFPSDGKSRFLVVGWGFDLSGQVSGKMALDPAVNITFGASGGEDPLFAFVRAVDPAMHARDAFLALLKAWCTPGAVADDASSLPPGCWLITEVTGQLSANLGFNAGYDFNWVKQVSVNDLEGDIGLRISLGLAAVLTAQLASKFYLVLNRDSATSGVRLRLFRAKTKGYGFALNTGASVTTSTGSFLPENLDDFIRAILGIHDAQLIKFLQASNLHDIANALGAEFLQQLRMDGDVNQAFTDLQNLLQKWNDLPHEVSTVIWNAAAKVPDLTAIQNVVQQIATLDENSIHNLLDSLLHNVSFYNTPVCQWLESAAGTGLFDLYESTKLDVVRHVATKAAGILDGSTLQDTLVNLKSQVDKAVNLPALESAVGNNDLTGVAVWVTQQLAKFLGIDLSHLNNNLAKIDAAIATIRAKSQEIYQATLKALNNSYGFSLAYAYNASNTQSALIDAQFADSAQSSLASAIKGDFSQILAEPIPGVTLNVCTLAHAITRQAHIETHLPWMTGVSDDLATGYPKQTLAGNDGGRLQFFEAGATDPATMKRDTTLKRFASCSIGISAQASGVRKFNVSAVDFGYSFVTSNTKTTCSAFEYDFGPAALQYFPAQFGPSSSATSPGPFNSWVYDWVKATGAATGDGVIGNMWVNLQIRSRAMSGVDWVSALLDGTQAPDYMAMSRAMQDSIRKYLLVAYADNPSQFANVPGKNTISAFLVYTALPGRNDFTFDGNTLKPNPKGDIVWDVRDPQLATAVTQAFAGPPLRQSLSKITNLLAGIPELKSSAQFYQNADAEILGFVLQDLQTTDPYITLLQNEKAVIDGAKAAFESLRQAGGKQLQQALPQFSTALINLVTDFNRSLMSLSLDAPQVMRLFAPLVFGAAVDAMFADVPPLPQDALMDVAVLKGTSLQDPAQPPSQDQIVLRQHVTSF